MISLKKIIFGDHDFRKRQTPFLRIDNATLITVTVRASESRGGHLPDRPLRFFTTLAPQRVKISILSPQDTS